MYMCTYVYMYLFAHENVTEAIVAIIVCILANSVKLMLPF